MNLFEVYQAAVSRREIVDDARQLQLIGQLQHIADEMKKPIPWYKLWEKNHVKGLYIWGPVGGGKTYLMDLFYQHIEIKQKARFHFHHFMQQVDNQLRLLQGHPNPLPTIAKKLAKTTRLLCLDEFLVNDVADAMILAELLTAIIENQVVLVATANTAPNNLYLNGVRRERFLPAIDLIKSHCDIFELVEHRDYRMGHEALSEAYVYPLGKTATATLNQQFNAVATDQRCGGTIMIQHRAIDVVKLARQAVWFEFDVICNLPRCQLDYLEIANLYDIVFVSNIPKLSEDDTVKVVLLMNFIDVMYDRHIRLVISAAVTVPELYTSGGLITSFQRTRSRLEEMQSVDYLSRPVAVCVQSSLNQPD